MAQRAAFQFRFGRHHMGGPPAGATARATVASESSRAGVVTRQVSPELAADREVMRTLRRDMKVLRGLRHTNLVSVVDFEAGPPATITYEAVRGTTLAHLLEVGGALDLSAAMVMYDDCLAGLQALHSAGVVHGNVRPAAFAIETAGAVMLRDAGVPRPAAQQPAAGPADADGDRSVVADLYAAAAVFYEAVTGRAPGPEAADPTAAPRAAQGKAVGASVPVGARMLLLRGLDKDVSVRWASAADTRREVADTARSFLGSGWRRSGRAWLADTSRTRAADALPPGEELMSLVSASAGGIAPGARQWDSAPVLVSRRVWAVGVSAVVATVAAIVLTQGGSAKAPLHRPTSLPPLALSTPQPTMWPTGSATASAPGSSATITPDPRVLSGPVGSIFTPRPSGTPRPTHTPGPPATSPPVTSPPVTSPPVTSPPVTSPPVTSPPVTSPPITPPPPSFAFPLVGTDVGVRADFAGPLPLIF